jgi:hypothetical protein
LTELETGTKALFVEAIGRCVAADWDGGFEAIGGVCGGKSLVVSPNTNVTVFESRSHSSLADESSRFNLLLQMSVLKPGFLREFFLNFSKFFRSVNLSKNFIEIEIRKNTDFRLFLKGATTKITLRAILTIKN